ncbi:SAM-dependent methyltransferase [Micavibrio aeruginosavorus]|uniref:Cyclopropane-fatty-acyl-phospholipid synthase, plant type n=1 Tax=Micavibrio aeruginosavorus EPB TaxID=349215 RepID=M4VZU0_9BACT|nr:cyclopropane-fatty-acyl-phospholipid synthase family protein [Micavibrio aeruginosavorus]AGH98709.1 Cyclopropane-fatty-acyl-phospholipid synthase, plant type [Micavibrio aeruginosavorus EPB]
MLDRLITNRFLESLNNIRYGSLSVTTPDGKIRSFHGNFPGATAELVLHDWHVLAGAMCRGDIALAETYRDGKWDSPDPASLFEFGMQNQSVLDDYIAGASFGRVAARMAYIFTRNTIRGSRKNIHAHYDIGNDFYALWLDPTMTYSAAMFSNQNEPLDKAQNRKYDRIIERMKPSGRLLEIGCGWGGFAERAMEKGDYAIKGLTISQEQHDYASRRLGKNATIALEDYRHQKGLYDQIVSIEMFEAVGEKFWPVYFSKIKSLLAQKGAALIQTITISDACFDRYRKGGDAIRTFIFPGGMLPSPERFRVESEKAGLQVSDSFAFGQDYALTLTRWLENFDARVDDVKAMGFDDKFIRLWRFYLTSCIAAFRHGRTDVMQWELRHAA